jgi:hypothetical protein
MRWIVVGLLLSIGTLAVLIVLPAPPLGLAQGTGQCKNQGNNPKECLQAIGPDGNPSGAPGDTVTVVASGLDPAADDLVVLDNRDRDHQHDEYPDGNPDNPNAHTNCIADANTQPYANAGSKSCDSYRQPLARWWQS